MQFVTLSDGAHTLITLFADDVDLETNGSIIRVTMIDTAISGNQRLARFAFDMPRFRRAGMKWRAHAETLPDGAIIQWPDVGK